MEFAHNDEQLQRLLKALLDLLWQEVQVKTVSEHAVRPKLVLSQSSVFLDFSLHQLKRGTAKAVPLPHSLPWEMLQQLCRSRLSLARFQLLPRFKQSVGQRAGRQRAAPQQSMSAFRHELTVLRRVVDQFDLQITIERHGKRICARLPLAIQTNILNARLLAREATARLAALDVSAALHFAEAALKSDFDCVGAARVVLKALRREDHGMYANAIMRSRVCVARAIVRFTAVVRRLDHPTTDSDVARALRIAQRSLTRLEPLWQDLLSWPSDDSPLKEVGWCEARVVRDFIEAWVKASRGDALAYGRFGANPIVVAVSDQLLERRLKQNGSSLREQTARELTAEIFEKLLINGWSPAPVSSAREFEDQLLTFLARRIDWETLLRRAGSDHTEWRDELHDVGDADDDNNDPNDDNSDDADD